VIAWQVRNEPIWTGLNAALDESGGRCDSLANACCGPADAGGIDLQPAASVLKHDAIWFHNVILMPIITAITLLVLGLIVWIAMRYNKKSNPVPARSATTPRSRSSGRWFRC
jgi:cytochrome c oxidase subunit 2